MQKRETRVLATVAGLMVLVCHSTRLTAQEASATDMDDRAMLTAVAAPKTRFLVIGKGKIADPQGQQERAIVAVRKIAKAAQSGHRDGIVDAVAEAVMTKDQYRRGEAKEKVTGAIFRKRLTRLAAKTTLRDTVVIYTHSHGRKNGFEESQPLGGIVMDLPVRRPGHRGTLLWDEYADLLLKIPAKNTVVLTMSCFSGGLVEYLNSPQVKRRWQDRRQQEGRNLIVLTSQNKDLVSPPIGKDGELVNPFTLAVAKALAWEADGFELVDGKPAKLGRSDGKLTAGELIDYILYATENTTSEAPRRRNIARPQLTGSFSRRDVLFERAEPPRL